MTRILVIANTEGGVHSLHVTAGADVDVIELNEFLTGDSQFGIDYEPESYVEYVEQIAQTIATRGGDWDPADLAEAQRHLDSAAECIRLNYGERLAEELDPRQLDRARTLNLLP